MDMLLCFLSLHTYWPCLGIDDAKDALFITDIITEAEAANSTGLQVLLSVRPGNAEITKEHNFRTIASFNQI